MAGESAKVRELYRMRLEFGAGAAARKAALLRAMERATLGSANLVRELHEAASCIRAFPDNPEVLELSDRILFGFARRRDLRRHRRALASSGIAGTATHYPFFQPTASWLARRWPGRLHLDWPEFRDPAARARLERLLGLLVLWSETPALDELPYSLRTWLRLLRGPGETDATFLVRRFDALSLPAEARQLFYEEYDLPLRLDPGPGTPERTTARWPGGAVVYQSRPLRRERPDLLREIRRPPLAVRELSPSEGRRLIELARVAMVSRQRDLDAFCNADARDARLVDAGDGLQFAVLGVKPEKRLLLESFYGFVTLRNGVPIGYMGASALMNSSEIAFNQFETWRGAEAAWIYARAASMVRALFGADTFCMYAYQLGYQNEEGVRSGAWWFYRKMGFRPRAPHVLALEAAELAAMKRRPGHRTSMATLRRMAEENMYLALGRARDDVIGIFPLEKVGERVVRFVAERFGSDRERAEATLAAEAGKRLGAPGWRRLSPGERLGFVRWAPLVAALPGVERWTVAQRKALYDVMRAKGGRRESDYVWRFDAHRALRRALAKWVEIS